jgi:serine/threonine-protein kinase RsbW
LTYPQTSQIETETNPVALKAVLSWFDQFKSAPIPHQVWLQCQIAVIEGFTNAMRHAHVGLPESTPIKIEVSLTEDVIYIRIWDQGPGFDLMSTLRHKLNTTHRESEGGRGLKIIYLVADRLTYEPVAGVGNCLYLEKTFCPVQGD